MSGGGGGRQQGVTQSGDPGLVPVNEYMSGQLIGEAQKQGGLGNLLAPQSYMFTDHGIPGGPESQAIGSLKDFYSRPALDPYTAAGIGRMNQAADPYASTIAGRDIFNTIAAPAIRNNATASGMGRSGAVGESLAMAGTQMALPILQQSNQYGMDLGKALQTLGQILPMREGQNLQSLYGLAAQPRMESAAAQQGGRDNLLSMLSRFPMSSGAGQSMTSGLPGAPDQSGQMAMSAITSLVSLIGMAAIMGGCHVAAALWADKDPLRFVCAFYEVNCEPHGWFGRQAVKLYARFGRQVAKSRLALKMLRPVFERIARVGARKLGVTLDAR